ncbi:MAG: DNA repair protein RecO [Maricaulaceae bacterium]|jgi:DNA repair protein RecO (recombination protein O)
MEWRDVGVVLSARPFGETGAIAEVLTRENGRCAGLVHGGASRRMKPLLQQGNRVQATWRARTADQLGSMALEGDELRAARLMDDAAAIDAAAAACALASMVLPEREPHGAVFEGLEAFLTGLETTELWPALLVKWEAGLLSDLGYGMDFSRCALTGSRDRLTHVSPRSGRAVDGESEEAEPYRDKLLKLPPFLLGRQAALAEGDVASGFALTGYFLERRILWPADRQLPDARARLIARLEKAGRL